MEGLLWTLQMFPLVRTRNKLCSSENFRILLRQEISSRNLVFVSLHGIKIPLLKFTEAYLIFVSSYKVNLK